MLNTLSAFDLETVQTLMNNVALYLTIAIFAVIVIFGILIRTFKKDSFRNYLKISVPAFTGYAVGILALFFSVKIAEYASDGYIDTTFWLITALLITSVVLLLIGAALRIAKPSALKLFTQISFGIIGIFSLSIIVYRMVLDFQSNVYDATSQILLYVLTAILVAVLVVITLVFGKKRNAPTTKTIAFGGVTIATSFALSYIQFFNLPSGGSITLASLLPVMVFSYIFGMRKGMLVGLLYGILQFIQAPWFLHPMQFLLDYPLAFAAIAFAGLFKELKLFEKLPIVQFLLGATATAIFRYFAHVISGIYVFGSGDPENYSAVGWSFMYNAFVFADMAISVIAGGLLFSSKTFLHQMEAIAVEEKRSHNFVPTENSESKFEVEEKPNDAPEQSEND